GFLSDLLSGAGTFAIDKLLGWLREEDEGAAPDAGGRQLRGAQPHVNNAAYALADMVGGIRMMQAFNQSMAGGHPRGLAVDFIDSVSKLNRLADAIVRTGGFDNFNYMAWQARLWSPGRGWRPQGRGYGNDPFHRWHLHAEWYDQGGILHPGLSMVANGTGRPEAVLTAPQWNTLATLAGQARMLPDTMYLRDYNGELVARMRVEARDTIRSEVEPLQREQRQQIGVEGGSPVGTCSGVEHERRTRRHRAGCLGERLDGDRHVRDVALEQARLLRLQRILLLLGHVPGFGVGDVLLQPHEQLHGLAYRQPHAHRPLDQDVDAPVRPDHQHHGGRVRLGSRREHSAAGLSLAVGHAPGAPVLRPEHSRQPV